MNGPVKGISRQVIIPRNISLSGVGQWLTARPNFGVGKLFANCLCFSRMFSPAYLEASRVGPDGQRNVLAADGAAAILAQKPGDRPTDVTVAPKTPLEIARSLLAECPQGGAATMYIDAAPQMVQFGVTTIDVTKLSYGEMTKLMEEAKVKGLALYYHAPWLEKMDGQRIFQPNPRESAELFTKLTELAKAHYAVFKEMSELVIHVTGQPSDWKTWVSQTSPYARIVIENAFRGPAADVVRGKGINNGFAYFQNSDFHGPSEVIEFARALGQVDICFDQAHGFAGYRPDGKFHALGDLLYVEELIDAGFTIRQMHRAAVPRQLAGQSKGEMTADQLDTHDSLTPFTREWFLANFNNDEQGVVINRVFDKLAVQDRKADGIAVTYEIKPGAVEKLGDYGAFATEFV
jgi:hypothetical protein